MAFPKTHNFNYYRGDTFEFIIELKTQSGSDFDISPFDNYVFRIANKRGSGATQYAGLAVKVDPASVKCTITPTVGRTLAAGDYFYDVQITDTTPDPDTIYTVLTGVMTVIDDVSGAV
jgi:hypothetical protein